MNEDKFKKVLINRINPEQIKPTYINDAIVTHTNDEFFITFSQIERPAILSEEKIKELSSIDAIAKSKLIVSPAFFKRIIEVFESNYKTYLSKSNAERNEE